MNSFLQNHFIQLNDSFNDPELELRILLKKSSINKKDIIFSNFKIENIDILKFKEAFKRRINREPISKIYNEKSFWKYDFFVNTHVLDPRPETELIIEKVIEYFPNENQKLKILDICTGSGCLGISLAKQYKNSIITATDISSTALKVARLNTKNLNCDNIKFYNCNLINKIDEYDIVVSNPPYLTEKEYYKTSKEIQLFEPKIALIGGFDGLKFYRNIAAFLPKILKVKSLAFLEIGNKQKNQVIKIFKNKKIKCQKIVKDIQNFNRLLVLKKNVD